jgi:hypothetical protein
MAIAIVFPSAADPQPAIDKFTAIADIVYRKDIAMTPLRGGALLQQIYLGQPWLNQQGTEAGFYHKQQKCFPRKGVMTILLLDIKDAARLRMAKEDIRKFYNLGNHSLHTTDSVEETLRVARTLFNPNSLEVLSLNAVGDRFHQSLLAYRDWLFTHGIDAEDACIDSGAVLAALGLRDSGDIDFLYRGNAAALPPLPHKVECHNAAVGSLLPHPIADILDDPRLHFWYMGVKFCAPDVVIAMKRRRGEAKDRRDIRLLAARRRGTFARTFATIHALARQKAYTYYAHANYRARWLLNTIKSRLTS